MAFVSGGNAAQFFPRNLFRQKSLQVALKIGGNAAQFFPRIFLIQFDFTNLAFISGGNAAQLFPRNLLRQKYLQVALKIGGNAAQFFPRNFLVQFDLTNLAFISGGNAAQFYPRDFFRHKSPQVALKIGEMLPNFSKKFFDTIRFYKLGLYFGRKCCPIFSKKLVQAKISTVALQIGGNAAHFFQDFFWYNSALQTWPLFREEMLPNFFQETCSGKNLYKLRWK